MSKSKEIQLACMRDLHEVLLRYDADLHYTIDDDGIHLTMQGQELAVFFNREQLSRTVQAEEDQLQRLAMLEI